MALQIYGIKNCDTMKKAFKWLSENEVAYEFHDYKKSGVPVQTLKTWLSDVGVEKVVNRRGTTWRKLSEKEKELLAGHATSDEAIEIICQNASLIKRPIIMNSGQIIFGFNASEYHALLR